MLYLIEIGSLFILLRIALRDTSAFENIRWMLYRKCFLTVRQPEMLKVVRQVVITFITIF